MHTHKHTSTAYDLAQQRNETERKQQENDGDGDEELKKTYKYIQMLVLDFTIAERVYIVDSLIINKNSSIHLSTMCACEYFSSFWNLILIHFDSSVCGSA